MFDVYCACRTKEQSLASSSLTSDVFLRKDRSKAGAGTGAFSGSSFLSQNIAFQAYSAAISKARNKKKLGYSKATWRAAVLQQKVASLWLPCATRGTMGIQVH